ncbi:hypothetical protein [Cyclobacterium salsum]|uniref:hypothetical protein n=1 Tax=Cyclobacterium salsum TaxID=2666329 RepID=UPI001391349E|nr:hypothetical protein [Cyclobacterium salsum]
MKNQTKLMLANLFALVSVSLILAVSSMFNLDLTWGSGALVPQVMLVLVPQAGFVYLLWKASRVTSQEALA